MKQQSDERRAAMQAQNAERQAAMQARMDEMKKAMEGRRAAEMQAGGCADLIVSRSDWH